MAYKTATPTLPPGAIFPYVKDATNETLSDGLATFTQITLNGYAWGSYTLRVVA